MLYNNCVCFYAFFGGVLIMIDKKIMWKIITFTAVALASAILITAVGGVVMLVSGMGDNEPPVIVAENGNVVTINRGESFSYRNQVSVSDNSGKECDLKWTTSVDQNTAGSYKVTYTATDKAGNEQTFTLTVKVVEVRVENDKLMSLVESLAKSKLGYDRAGAEAKGYSKEKIVRDIFNFVRDPKASADNANIVFNDKKSNSPNQYDQNGHDKREGWKTDWQEEAYLTLSGDMSGDCYTFYSVSKAFFEYFGIPNVGIQRTTASPMTQQNGGTHYWNIVKVEGGWYYYDSTRFAGHFEKCDQPCLVTEAQLLSYVTGKGVKNSGYYWIEKSDAEFFDADDNNGVYPKVETKEITN